MEDGGESVLDAIFQEIDLAGEETLEDPDACDVEMPDALEALEAGGGRTPSSSVGGGDPPVEGGRKKPRKKCRKRKKKRSAGSARGDDGGAGSSIADINRFVIQTCRHLKEHKSYLLWSAVGCLGVSAVKDLVKECTNPFTHSHFVMKAPFLIIGLVVAQSRNRVDAILSCGGQKTNDGRRYRTSGGILFNILKTREPKAYKEIMARGREFEKQLKVSKGKTATTNTEGTFKNSGIPSAAGEALDPSEAGANGQQQLVSSEPVKERKKLADRMRIPVSYDDLLEEGEIPQ
ncbi:hypothetical protein ZIOFF_006524 [Zingiber officinale]|uniref:Phosphorylated adapter RNA export protein n=1 Tax=Zingiber officinale TaxID=94328 RepID=A0A8J5HYG8_ZINOF|nr:hypothetical protein ZIOFF_006524 [Zingiber officinale]